MTRPGQGVASAFFVISALYFLAGAHFYAPVLEGSGLYRTYNHGGWIYASIFIAAGLWHAYRRGSIVTSRLLGWIFIGALLTLVPLLYPVSSKIFAIPRLLGLFAVEILKPQSGARRLRPFIAGPDQWPGNRAPAQHHQAA